MTAASAYALRRCRKSCRMHAIACAHHARACPLYGTAGRRSERFCRFTFSTAASTSAVTSRTAAQSKRTTRSLLDRTSAEIRACTRRRVCQFGGGRDTDREQSRGSELLGLQGFPCCLWRHRPRAEEAWPRHPRAEAQNRRRGGTWRRHLSESQPSGRSPSASTARSPPPTAFCLREHPRRHVEARPAMTRRSSRGSDP